MLGLGLEGIGRAGTACSGLDRLALAWIGRRGWSGRCAERPGLVQHGRSGQARPGKAWRGPAG